MASRSNISPATLPVEWTEAGIEVTYLDGRRVTYRAPPEATTEAVRAPASSQAHVLIADRDSGSGTVVYVNDHKTADEILQDSGVGRVLVAAGDVATVAPGVDAIGYREAVEIGLEGPTDRDVYVFVENQLRERAYQLQVTA